MTNNTTNPPREIEIVPFETPIPISCVTKDEGPLTKIVRIDPETKALIKDGSECLMSSGKIETILFSSPEGFSRLLRSRKNNQAIVHGLARHLEARLVTKSQLAKAGNAGEGTLSVDNSIERKTGKMLYELLSKRYMPMAREISL